MNKTAVFILWVAMTLLLGKADLVGEWRLAGDLSDSVGRSHGKFIGKEVQPVWVLNNSGTALSFSGRGDCVDCGNDASLSFGDGQKDRAFSIEAWVNMTERSGFTIASKNGEYTLINNNCLRLYLYDGNTGKRIYKSGGDLQGFESEWIHVVVTYDGSGSVDGINFYVDGRACETEEGGDKESYKAMNSKGGCFCIGGPAGANRKLVRTTKGLINGVRVYNHALSFDEVAAWYRQALPFLTEEAWQNTSALIEEQSALLERLTAAHPLGKTYSQLVESSSLAELKAEIQDSGKKGELLLSPKIKPLKAEIERTKNSVAGLKKMLKGMEMGAVKTDDLCVCWVVDPMNNDVRRILPFCGSWIPGEISNQLMVAACAGEYEPASFVVTAFADLNSLRIVASDLKMTEASQCENISRAFKRFVAFFGQKSSDKAIIPASAVDVKLVKCWYQSGFAGRSIRQNKSRRVLIPELLLNDDSLVKVDLEKEENYLKLSFPGGDKYVWISDPAWDDTVEKKWKAPKEASIDNFPIKDAPFLLPVNVAAGRNQQFWLTVRVPDNAKPGLYKGEITLMTEEKEVGVLSLRLRVLPFKLSAPYYISSIDYHGRPADTGTVLSFRKTRRQFKKDLENMVAHGVCNCQHYSIRKEMLGEVLEIRRAVGMDNETLYLKGTIPIGNPTDSVKLEQIKRNVREILELVRPYGTKTVYFYGMDEVQGDLLKSQRPAWEAVRTAGGKIFVAGYGDNIKMMGDIQDMHVRAGPPSAEEAAKWHAYGHKIFCYNNPQCGVENPEIYRRNFGLLLWKNDYDGATDNAYQHSFGFTWNDFDHPVFSGHSHTYPAMDGPIDTIQWEGYREGVDDVRYVTTLQEMIAEAKESGGEAAKKRVLASEEYLKNLKKGDRIEKQDLSVIRAEIIRHLVDLQQEMNE